MGRINVHYGSPNANLKLDMYIPYIISHPNSSHYTSAPPLIPTLHPIIVFLPSQTRPFPSSKWLFSSLGSNLSAVLSVMVVIPDLTRYPEGGSSQRPHVFVATFIETFQDAYIHKFTTLVLCCDTSRRMPLDMVVIRHRFTLQDTVWVGCLLSYYPFNRQLQRVEMTT